MIARKRGNITTEHNIKAAPIDRRTKVKRQAEIGCKWTHGACKNTGSTTIALTQTCNVRGCER